MGGLKIDGALYSMVGVDSERTNVLLLHCKSGCFTANIILLPIIRIMVVKLNCDLCVPELLGERFRTSS